MLREESYYSLAGMIHGVDNWLSILLMFQSFWVFTTLGIVSGAHFQLEKFIMVSFSDPGPWNFLPFFHQ